MATEKQLENLRRFAKKAETATAIRKTAQVANGHGAKSHKEQMEARQVLEDTLGSKKAAQAMETEILAAGGKPKSLLRRLLGT